MCLLFCYFEVTAMFNATYAQLYVTSTNTSLTAPVDMVTKQHNVGLSQLTDASLTLGAQNPNTSVK